MSKDEKIPIYKKTYRKLEAIGKKLGMTPEEFFHKWLTWLHDHYTLDEIIEILEMGKATDEVNKMMKAQK